MTLSTEEATTYSYIRFIFTSLVQADSENKEDFKKLQEAPHQLSHYSSSSTTVKNRSSDSWQCNRMSGVIHKEAVCCV